MPELAWWNPQPSPTASTESERHTPSSAHSVLEDVCLAKEGGGQGRRLEDDYGRVERGGGKLNFLHLTKLFKVILISDSSTSLHW